MKKTLSVIIISFALSVFMASSLSAQYIALPVPTPCFFTPFLRLPSYCQPCQSAPKPDVSNRTATWAVNTINDPAEWDESDAILSLREAISRAAAGDTIIFNCSLADKTITLSGTEISIDKGIKIDATSVGGMTIDANSNSRVFNITGGTEELPVELIGLTVTGGIGDYFGGGIKNFQSVTSLKKCIIKGNKDRYAGGGIGNFPNSTLTLTDCLIKGNHADSGGGIFSHGSLSLTRCTITDNTARVGGGFDFCEAGINNGYEESVLLMDYCNVSANTANIAGGIFCVYAHGAVISNSVIFGNMADSEVGGIDSVNGSDLKLINCTVAGNAATKVGGIRGGLILINSIVAANYAETNPDGDGNDESHNNIIGYDPGFKEAPVFESGRLTNFDTIDLSLTSTSAAIDQGDNSAVSVETDYAGNPRIVALRKAEPTVDLGAYEYQIRRRGTACRAVDSDGKSRCFRSLRCGPPSDSMEHR